MEYNNKWIGNGGIDASSPFLDRDLLEFLMQVPGETLLWDGVPKALLRRAMHGVLPAEIENRKWKADFRPIEEQSLIKSSNQMLEVLEGDTRSAHFGYVDAPGLQQHLDSVRRQLPTDPQAAWSLEPVVALEIWLRTFFA
jgi:asparagine synthase (glutamine-hydrolysing)